MITFDFINFAANAFLFFLALRFLQTHFAANGGAFGSALAYIFH
jgi:hypothetical protein